MAYQYIVVMNDGSRYPAPSSKHHSNHTEDEFKKHLVDFCIQTSAAVASALIANILLNGAEVTDFSDGGSA